MKKDIKYVAAALLLSVVSISCQKEDNFQGYNGDPNSVRVNVTVGSIFSRSNPLGEGITSTVFGDGDKISLTAGNQGAVIYTFDGLEWVPATGTYLKWEENEMYFSAYYPVTPGTGMDSFTLPADQSSAAKIASADYMTAGKSITKSGIDPVDIIFQRRTARVIVEITGFGDQYVPGEKTVRNVTIGSGAAGYTGGIASGEVTAVTPVVNGTGGINTTYTVLVIPSAGNVTGTFVTLTDGKGNGQSVKGIPAMEEGKSYRYTLHIGKDTAVITGVTVTEWTTGLDIPDGETEELKLWDGSVSTGLTKGWGTESDPFVRKEAKGTNDIKNSLQ